MRIGELADRTDTTPRLLRYYEEQGLITVGRAPNGYRDYDPRLVDRVTHIRGLLEAGLSTRLIKQILPCLDEPHRIHFADATPEILAILEEHRDRLARRIEALSRDHAAVAAYVGALKKCALGVERPEEQVAQPVLEPADPPAVSPQPQPASVVAIRSTAARAAPMSGV